VKKAPFFRGQNRPDGMTAYFIDRYRVTLDAATLANFSAMTGEAGDGIITLTAPVLAGFCKSWQRQWQQNYCYDRSDGEAFAGKFSQPTPPAFDTEAAEKDGEAFPAFAGTEACFIKRRINPRIDGQQPGGARNPRIALPKRI